MNTSNLERILRQDKPKGISVEVKPIKLHRDSPLYRLLSKYKFGIFVSKEDKNNSPLGCFGCQFGRGFREIAEMPYIINMAEYEINEKFRNKIVMGVYLRNLTKSSLPTIISFNSIDCGWPFDVEKFNPIVKRFKKHKAPLIVLGSEYNSRTRTFFHYSSDRFLDSYIKDRCAKHHHTGAYSTHINITQAVDKIGRIKLGKKYNTF